MSAELDLNYKTVLSMRHKIQADAEREQPKTPLSDIHSEQMKYFKMREKKEHLTLTLMICPEEE